MAKELRIETVIRLTEDEFGITTIPTNVREAILAFEAALTEVGGASVEKKIIAPKGARGPRKSKKLAAVA